MSMIKCPDCSAEIAESAKTCVRCGSVLVEDEAKGPSLVGVWTEEADRLRKLGKSVEGWTTISNLLIVILGIAVLLNRAIGEGIVLILIGVSGITIAQLIGAFCNAVSALIEIGQAGLRR